MLQSDTEVGSVGVQLKRWTRDEYRRLVEQGVLREDDRVQLIDGEIVEMPPQNPAHAGTVHLVAEALRALLRPGYSVRVQLPLALSPSSEPEPDVAVVPGAPRDYLREHPASAVLGVEVAVATGEFDRGRKAKVYAGAGVPEYWVVDPTAGTVDVFRDPAPGGYGSCTRLGRTDRVTPLAAPGHSIAACDLLP